jgi:signal transduction histidine kinase
MSQLTRVAESHKSIAPRAAALFAEHQLAIFRRTDRMFAGLMVLQWIGGIIAALVISPRAWSGTWSETHLHVWAALFLGGAIISLPILLALTRPGAVLTRHVIAVAQMLMSALLIHLTGGRIETHFHVFGSLAFLAFYRDWRVFVPATLVVALDHLLRGIYWPQSVYGVLTASPWRFVEHAAWVIFEDVFLTVSAIQSRSEMWNIAERQAELEATNEVIAARVDERTAELRASEESLRAFAARLEQSNRELQDFAYVASHDLQEPLRKIQAFGDRLKARFAEALGEQGRDYLDRMHNAAARMQNLITDLLAFSRISTKAQPAVLVDLAQATREVLSDLETRIEQTGGRVEIGELPAIEADPLQMRQLLQNLVGNALKFHREDVAPEVKIAGKILNGTNGHAHNRRCEIVVEDNGIGFDEKYLDRIFNVFQRLHGRGKYDGTGVGLAICRKIVERHAGTITAKSEPGKGTTFIVTLPMKQAKDEGSNG